MAKKQARTYATRDPQAKTRDPKRRARKPAPDPKPEEQKKPLVCKPEPDPPVCPKCGHGVNRVYGTGPDIERQSMNRYRKCSRASCGNRWVTFRPMQAHEVRKYVPNERSLSSTA